MESIVNKAKHEGRDLTKNEVKDLDRLQAKIDAVNMVLGDGIFKDLDLRKDEDRARALEILDQPVEPPWRPGGPVGGGLGGEQKTFFNRLFPNIVPEDGGFKDIGEFFGAVLSGRHDPRLSVVSQHLAGAGAAGGFALPTAQVVQLFEAIVQQSIFLSRVQTVGLTAIEVPGWVWDDLDQSGNLLYGGFRIQWQGEGMPAGTTQQAKLRQVTLHAKKLSLYTSISREMDYFGGDFTQKLEEALRRTIAAGIDEAFMTADGVGKPMGFLTPGNPALIAVPRALANKIAYADVVAMVARFLPAAFADAIWVAHPSILTQLLTMKDDAGNLIWQPSGRDASPDTLMGRPLFFNDRLPALGQKGDLSLVAPRFYIGALAPSIWIDANLGPEWEKDLISIRAITFVDGMPSWNRQYTPPSGDTLSWCVTLDVPA
ncbi:MAG: phage major capsid protein [Firmicutes bacterium]|nr:phage major capsid protein [Bacillota bacterium]